MNDKEPGLTETEALIEALSRIEAMDLVLGDPGGSRHPKDYWATERQVRWVEPLASDVPDWDCERDMLGPFRDAHSEAITTRALELRSRVRAEEARYQERVAAQQEDNR